MKTALMFLVSMLAVACPSGHANPQDDLVAGMRLSAKQASDLEAAVAADPDDFAAHAKLLGYYSMTRFNSTEAKESSRKNLLWIISNHPQDDIAGKLDPYIDPSSDRSGYDVAKRLWMEQVKSHPGDARVVGHAGEFFVVSDRATSENLLKQAQAMDPHDPEWPDQLGQFYAQEDGRDAAAKALAKLEQAQSEDTSEAHRMYRLDALAKSAFEAGEIDKASGFANALLAEAQELPKDWNYGNAIHQGNNVLGRIALKRGDIKQADAFLLKAGRTPGSPQLDSFGPNMSLARDLLQAGEKQTVLQYFELCRKFWEGRGATIDDWELQVKAGKVPEFGPNLSY